MKEISLKAQSEPIMGFKDFTIQTCMCKKYQPQQNSKRHPKKTLTGLTSALQSVFSKVSTKQNGRLMALLHAVVSGKSTHPSCQPGAMTVEVSYITIALNFNYFKDGWRATAETRPELSGVS